MWIKPWNKACKMPSSDRVFDEALLTRAFCIAALNGSAASLFIEERNGRSREEEWCK
jgi:hypothetical protein